MSTDHLVARFYDHPRLNVEESKKAGHKVYDTVLMVELRNRGERGESVSKTVKGGDTDETEYYKAAFPGAWAKYKGGGDSGFVSGTLLKALDIEVGEIQMLEAMDIRTVEQLVQVADSAASKIRGGLTLKSKAMKYLEAQKYAKDGNIVDMLTKLQAKVEALEKEKQELEANQKKRPGRPKKEVDDGDVDAQAAM